MFFSVIFGFAVCDDFACFRDAMTKCQIDSYREDKEFSICRSAISGVRCKMVAVKQCNLDFGRAALEAYTSVVAICTKGTDFYNALRDDENCGIETATDNDAECSRDYIRELAKISMDPAEGLPEKVSRILCRYLDSMADCNREKFRKCSKDSQRALNKVMDTTVDLYKQICRIVPSA